MLELEVRLVEATPMPGLSRIAPYRDALATVLYDVVAVPRGRFEGDQVLVARWVVLDNQPVEGLDFEPGSVAILRLARMDKDSHYDSRLLLDDTGMTDLALHVEVRE